MASIDYLSGTVQGKNIEEVLSYVGRFSGGWVQGKGAHGYKACWASDGFRLFYDGAAGMGIYWQASGEGCAAIAADNSFQDWGAFMAEWVGYGFKPTRCDLAFDSRAGLVSVDTIGRKLEAKEYTSRYRAFNRADGYLEGEKVKDVLYLGTVESDTSICIYDKRLERLARGAADPGEWLRVEMRFKGKAAQGIVSWIVENPDLSGAEGFLASSISFREPTDGNEKDHWEISQWWQDFLLEAGKLRLQTVKPVRTLLQHVERFTKQHAATLAMLVLCMCNGRMKGEWLDNLIITGWGKMNVQQCALVRQTIGHVPGQGILLGN